MNLLLTSKRLQQPHVYAAFLEMLDGALEGRAVAIITTASQEWKERNKHAVATHERFVRAGFRRVQFVDLEHEDAELLREFDAIFISGGNPFYLLHHLNRGGGRRVLCELAHDGRPIVGSSAGAMVMGPDLSIASWFTPEMNALGNPDAPALELVPFRVFPHFGRQEDHETQLRAYQDAEDRAVVRLPDTHAIRWRDGEGTLLSPTGQTRLGW